MEQSQVTETIGADYDLVGEYCQDDINGFDDILLTRLIDLIDPCTATNVLDAMAGDGNLTKRLIAYCLSRGLQPPALTALDYSHVQIENAQRALSEYSVRCIWGDMLTLAARDGSMTLPLEAFDRVMIKSGNHELPLAVQEQLYSNVARLLSEGGLFINLGFLFDDPDERDELRRIARVKDSLAGLQTMVRNRHFLTRDELYRSLAASGLDVIHAEPISYTLRSDIIAKHYFPFEKRIAYEAIFQRAQIIARLMRRRGRIHFGPSSSVMHCTGEITVARKPNLLERTGATYRDYPYDFVRNIAVHQELVTTVARLIKRTESVLDLGCGLGLLRERLPLDQVSYLGIDVSEEFIATCQSRFADIAGTSFFCADIQDLAIISEGVDVVTLLNVIYHPAIDTDRILRIAYGSLKPGGMICISGPSSAQSFSQAEGSIRAQLERDGLLPKYSQEYQRVCDANARLLSARGHYYTADEMVRLLSKYGFRTVIHASPDIYYGTAYLVAARKA